MWLYGEDSLHRGNGKGPEGSLCVEYSKTSEVVKLVEVEWSRGKAMEDEDKVINVDY